MKCNNCQRISHGNFIHEVYICGSKGEIDCKTESVAAERDRYKGDLETERNYVKTLEEDKKSLIKELNSVRLEKITEHRRREAAEAVKKCNTCHHYIRSEELNHIKGCGYLPNGKSPKKWFCADYKPIIKEAGE